ncbi:MAG: beta strand repeat-containing protein [Flexibacteraceae bacterium]
MQKILSLIVVLCLSLAANAQPFFENVAYRGAMGTTNWAGAAWTNWNPQNTNYPSVSSPQGRTVVNVSGDISGNVTWTSSQLIVAAGAVHVLDGATLTIEPGCVIRGSLASRFTLIVSRGGRIVANGTASNPIVFTSIAEAGQRVRGDWGGVLICGRATTNKAGVAKYEALPSDPLAEYGGSNDNDNSGSMSYVRIEYAGFNYLPNQEINSLTMCAIGKGTQINNIMTSFGLDDQFEWFGGTSNHKYLIAYAGTDDDFDADQGYRGNWQFLLGVRNPGVFETGGARSSNGFEIDNNTGFNGVTGSATGESVNGAQLPTPTTEVLASNVTLVGPIRTGETNANHSDRFNYGLELRSAAKVSVQNSIITGYFGLTRFVNGGAASTHSTARWHAEGTSSIANCIYATTSGSDVFTASTNQESDLTFNPTTYLNANNVRVARNAFTFATAGYTGNPLGDLDQINFASVNYALAAGSTATTGASFAGAIFTGKVISANTPVVTTAVSANNVCAGTSVTFTASVTNATATSYQWKKNDINISGETSATLTTSNFANGDVFTVLVNGSVTSAGITMVVAGTKTPTVQILSQDAPTGAAATLGTAGNPFIVCANQVADFTAIATNGGTTPSFSWTVNSNAAASTKDFAFSQATPGTYQVAVVMTSSEGCASPATATSATYYVTVTDAQTVSIPAFSSNGYTVANATRVGSTDMFAVCTSGPINVTLTVLPLNAGSNPSFQWKRNGNNVGVNSQTYTIDNFVDGDVFTVTVTSSLSCGGAPVTSPNITLVRNSVPTLTVTNSSEGAPVNPGSSPTVTFTITSSTGKFPQGTSFVVGGPQSPAQITTLTAPDADGVITYTRVIDANNKSGVYTFTATTPACAASSVANSTVSVLGDLVVSSDATLSAGSYTSITVLNGATATLGANTSVSNYVVVNNGGTLNFNGFNITGTATFTANSGSTLRITDAAGITSTGATGNIQSTGTRSFSSSARYFYSGGIAQSTGNGVTTANTLRVMNNSTVTVSSALNVTDKVELVSGSLNANGLLTLVSTASKTAIIDNFTNSWTGTISGNVNTQRFVSVGETARRFQLAPLAAGATVSTFGSLANVNTYSETANNWVAASSNASVPQGTSVLPLFANSTNVELTGTVTTSNLDVQYTRTSGSYAPFVPKGYNALGNPYNAPVSWSALAAANNSRTTGSNGFAWVWNNGQYAVINNAGVATNGGSNTIAVGQGFLVRRASGALLNTNFTFLASARVSSTTNTFIRNTANNAIVRINVSGANTTISDEVVVSADVNASATSEDDAEKLFSNEETAVNAFISNNEGNFSFVTTPAFENMGVATLNVVTKVAGVYTINPVEINGFNGTLMIEDRTSGKMVEFNKPFTFNSNGGTSRFYIHFTSGNTSAISKSVDVFTTNNEVNVNFATVELANATINVYNTAGQVVKTVNANGNTSVSFDLNKSNVYVVKVSTPEGVVSRKIFYSVK